METIQITYDVCRSYLFDQRALLGEDLYSKLLGFLRARNVASLSKASSLFDWQSHTVDVFKSLRQVEAFFKKNEAFSDDSVCTLAAKASFEAAERKCKRTNRRLDFYYLQRDRIDPDLQQWIPRAEDYIRRVLGDFDGFLGRLPELIRVTDGATASRSRRKSLPYLKVKKKYDCSVGAKPYLQALSQFFGYGDLRLRSRPVNRVQVVPKNYQTHRTIACEPDGNLPLQLAFDMYAKQRLRRKGINLSDQSRNQRMAYEGSVSGFYATIDLSSASDTVAYNTVAWLFPHPWFRYLCAIRSSFYKGSFGTGKYQKFSSMGNGATFCIETLIFAALCHAVGATDFSVYGDDIIIPVEYVDSLYKALNFFGFIVNQDKSFSHGPFRESCGKHWFSGIDVTPFYVRGNLKLKPEFCHVINGLVRIGKPLGDLWELCKDITISKKLPLVPINENSTSGVFVDVHSAYRLKLIRTKYHISRFRSYVPKGTSTYIGDIRTNFLWYLDAFRIKDRKSMEALVRSRTPITEHRYVRKWVGWFYPTGSTSDHLYWWSDYWVRP